MTISVSDSIPLQDEHLEELQFSTEDFTEEDVLPFLLQAQDIISKLESRVVELETDLSTIHRKYEYDRNDWLVGLSQKDQYIHHLSSKLQKLEFNTKEAIVNLSDMVDEDKLLPNLAHEQMNATIILCLNYLRQTQQAITPTVDAVFDTEDLEEGELERRQAAASEWQQNKDLENWKMPLKPVNLMDGLEASSRNSIEGSDLTGPTDLDSFHPTISDTTSASSLPEDELAPSLVFQHHPTLPAIDHTFCLNCKQLLTQLDQQIEQKAYLKRDLGSLASALTEEEQLRSDIEETKQALEEDVQEIATALFDNLNRILMDEVMNRDGLVRINRDLNGLLLPTLQAWDSRETQLKEIKELLVDLDSVVHQSANTTSSLTASADRFQSLDLDVPRSGHRRQPSSLRFSTNGPPNLEDAIHGISSKTIRIDGLIFDEFQLHLKALSATTHPTVPLTAYMKRVMAEDIDPCLFQNAASAWWKSPWFKRKLIDAITRNKCEIQSFLPNQSTFSSSSTSSSTSPDASHISNSSTPTTTTVLMPPKTKCACCGVLRVCEFRMRLQPTTTSLLAQKQPPWLPIDRFCRDRLVAVCDFYSFMSYLRQALMQHSATLSMFKQSLHFRRRMAVAKIGSIGLFDEASIIATKRRSAKRESIVLDHSGSGSDTASVVSMSDIQGLDGAGQIVIVH
ncbi:hypothetical protein CLU79DRAFT_758787 [Phycomyces nitens]|nr:hypothetical protein CLU79DRAFT_758787 [Phycomyces nitens]